MSYGHNFLVFNGSVQVDVLNKSMKLESYGRLHVYN